MDYPPNVRVVLSSLNVAADVHFNFQRTTDDWSKMNEHDWIKQFPAAVTVCDCKGIILDMNDKAARTFEKDGGYALIGKNLLDCHPEPARSKVERLLEACEKNVYTIEKNGVKKLIYQCPWFEDGQYAGFVELSLEIPFEMEHFVRS